MMEIPGDLYFTESHEWMRINDDGTVTVGISEHATEQLGDLVFVETPEIDHEADAEDGIAVVESVKAASDIYAPVAGIVVDANADLADSPEIINEDPYERGWIYRLKPNDVGEVEQFMSADAYQEFIDADA
ncbi:MAG: glycine cleavage system protein H [Gammaproteobacteria bacterium]|nr:MAG: glycine cleavage system protein H [Gammaproteobacteria bacterium]PIE34849.1 MAG: glycine cleavage system protein H [Gammaproteobacteria bacterium]